MYFISSTLTEAHTAIITPDTYGSNTHNLIKFSVLALTNRGSVLTEATVVIILV